jgi:hypothetical protein
VRGTPQQIIEKYNQLARDAQLSNDRVAAENFQQHAEHYTRMLGEAMREQEAVRVQQRRAGRTGGRRPWPARAPARRHRPGSARTAARRPRRQAPLRRAARRGAGPPDDVIDVVRRTTTAASSIRPRARRPSSPSHSRRDRRAAADRARTTVATGDGGDVKPEAAE